MTTHLYNVLISCHCKTYVTTIPFFSHKFSCFSSLLGKPQRQRFPYTFGELRSGNGLRWVELRWTEEKVQSPVGQTIFIDKLYIGYTTYLSIWFDSNGTEASAGHCVMMIGFDSKDRIYFFLVKFKNRMCLVTSAGEHTQHMEFTYKTHIDKVNDLFD